jgi:hypothetical protein
MFDYELQKAMDELFDELVPSRGKAESEAGEVVRAFNRIAYRYYNDGDKLGIGYGKETCNAAGRYLLKHDHGDPAILCHIGGMWDNWSDEGYEASLERLGHAIVRLISENPSMREAETEDMWDHYDKYEDVDDYEDEEEW